VTEAAVRDTKSAHIQLI